MVMCLLMSRCVCVCVYVYVCNVCVCVYICYRGESVCDVPPECIYMLQGRAYGDVPADEQVCVCVCMCMCDVCVYV